VHMPCVEKVTTALYSTRYAATITDHSGRQRKMAEAQSSPAPCVSDAKCWTHEEDVTVCATLGSLVAPTSCSRTGHTRLSCRIETASCESCVNTAQQCQHSFSGTDLSGMLCMVLSTCYLLALAAHNSCSTSQLHVTHQHSLSLPSPPRPPPRGNSFLR
jgi:hypothetical protein